MQAATKGTAENPVNRQAQPHKILKRIGSTHNFQRKKSKQACIPHGCRLVLTFFSGSCVFESNRAALTLYQAAERYIKANLNGRDKIPLAAWEKEYANLAAERKILNVEYLTLKDEVGRVEKISRSVQDILYEERRQAQPAHRRTQGVER